MKQAYNVILFTGEPKEGNNGYITYHKVSSLDKFRNFATTKYPAWKFATVYDHATKAKLEVIKPS